MRKFLITMMCIIMVVCFIPTVAMAGTGSVIQISSSEELAKIGTDENYPLNGSYELTNNITLSGEWTPIGTEANTFKGVFNGKDFTISGLTINSSNNYIGLIGILDGGRVENVKFANVAINGGSDVGVAVGRIINNGTVSGVDVLSGNVRGNKRVGGIVGSIRAYGTVENCSNAATVTAAVYNAGGIVGAAYYTVANQEMYVKNCRNTGAITSSGNCAGGIVGLSAANVSNCINSGAINGGGTSIGGIVGEQKTYGAVSNNNNNGAVTNNNNGSYGNGGIIGWLRYHGNGEADYYAQSAIISVTGNRNTGSVSGGNDAGGIIGTAYNSAVITENTNIAESLTATTFAAGIVGNYQTTETPAAIGPASNQLIFDDNASTTTDENITASCKDLLIYTNDNEVKNYVAQIGETKYATLDAALTAATSGDTVLLLRDVRLSVADVTKKVTDNAGNPKDYFAVYDLSGVTFDLNSKTLTTPNLVSTDITSYGFVLEGENVVVKNGNLVARHNDTDNVGSYALFIGDGGTVKNFVVQDVSMTGGLNLYSADDVILRNIKVGSTTYVKGTKYYAVWCEGGSHMTIEGGEISSDSTLGGALFGVSGEDDTITINGGTFDAKGNALTLGDGHIVIEGGAFTDFNKYVKANSSATICITGGTFTSDPTEYKSKVNCYKVIGNNITKTWTVTAGHTWDAGDVTTEPTYDTTGEKTYTCTVAYCGATKTEVIPKKARPSIPSIPTTPTDNVTNSGTSGTDNATTSADLSNTTSTSNGTTAATVDKTTADKIVDKAVANKSEEIVIDATANSATAANSTTTAQVTIPTDTLGAIAEKTEADVTIKTDVAEVKMDNAAAAAVSEQAEGDTVQIIAEKVAEETDKVEFELKVVCSDGKVISDFKGGNVAVTVALPKAMADKKVVCVYIDDNGHMSKVEGQKNADGTYTFVTGHFSSYAIMAEEEADAAIAAQKEAIKNIKIKLTSKQVKTKAGKKAVKITWTADAGDKVLDGVEVFRSTERYKGYGIESFYTSTKGGNTGSYTNTKSLKKGTKYYYRVRGYVLVDGQKVYTDYSTKAGRTV